MKTIIYYQSLLGSTKKYARWLGEELNSVTYTFSEFSRERIAGCENVVVMSGTYAGGMPLVGFLRNHWEDLKTKKVFVIAVGVIPADSPESIKSYDSIPEYIRNNIIYFKIPGKLLTPGVAGEPTRDKLTSILTSIRKESD